MPSPHGRVEAAGGWAVEGRAGAWARPREREGQRAADSSLQGGVPPPQGTWLMGRARGGLVTGRPGGRQDIQTGFLPGPGVRVMRQKSGSWSRLCLSGVCVRGSP